MTKQGGIDRSRYLCPRTIKGNDYLYFRMPGAGLVPLPLDQNSAEFRRCYDECLKKLKGKRADKAQIAAAPRAAASKPAGKRTAIAENERVAYLPGSIGRAIVCYLGSPLYQSKRPSTQYLYRRFCDEIRQVLGPCMIADLDLETVDIYIDKVIKTRGEWTAQHHLTMLNNIWVACRRQKDFGIQNKSNPTTEAVRPYNNGKAHTPHRPWTEDEFERAETSAPTNLRLALLLYRYGGQRGGDCVAVKWSDFDGKGLTLRPEKNYDADELPSYLECPTPLLDAILEAKEERDAAIAKRLPVADTILTNQWGEPWSKRGSLADAIRKHCEEIGLRKAGQGRGGLVPHGLRKNVASEIAELGIGGALGIKAVTLHKSSQQAEAYAKSAQQKVLNAKVVAAWNEQIAERKRGRVQARRAGLRRVK